MTIKKTPEKLASVSAIFKFSVRVKIAILFLVAFCLYVNSFSNQYALDDAAVITSNQYVQKGFAGIGKILTTDAYESYYKTTNSNQHLSGGRYRPLSIVLFAIEHQLWGEDPQERHFVNVLLYILCVLTIFYFLRVYLLKKIPYGEDIAFISALLFAIHPIHTEVVANIKSSDEILSLLFSMLTFIYSIKYRKTKKIWNLLLGIFSFFLALLAKEYAITLLILLPILFVVYFKDSLNESIKKSLPYYGVILFYFIIRIASIGFPVQHKELDILNNPYLLASPLQKMASEIFILGKYLYMLFMPYPLASDYGFAQIPYSDFSSPWVWLSIIAYGIILYGGIQLLRKRNVLAFAVFFFLLNLFMVSNFVINIGATMGERLVFHSSLGFTIIISFGIVELAKKIKMKQRSFVIAGLLLVLVVLCGTEAISRNRDWRNDSTLFMKDVNTIPNSVKANDNAGGQYINLSEQTADTLKSDSIARIGLKYLHKAIKLDDSDMDGYLNLGIAYSKLILPDSAKYYWDIARHIYSGYPNFPSYYSMLSKIFNYKGNKLAQKGSYAEAIHEFEKGIQCSPDNLDLWVNLGGTFFNARQYDSARYNWEKAAKINPDYPNIKQYLGMLSKSYKDSNSSPGFK